MTGRLLMLEEVDSTQDEARRQFLAGTNGPLWVLARRQTCGRGRSGRQWISPPGNLHLSLLFRPEAELRRWPELSLLAALVAHKATARLLVQAGRRNLRDALSLKWPNDLLLHGRKLGGILLETVEDATGRQGAAPMPDVPGAHETSAGARGRRALVIGWGLNLKHAPAPEQARWPAVSLAEEGLALEPGLMFEVLRDTFWRWYQVWQSFGPKNMREAWLKRAHGLGGMVRLRHGEEILQGRFADIGPAGELVLHMPEGERRMFHAGEIEQVEMNEGRDHLHGRPVIRGRDDGS